MTDVQNSDSHSMTSDPEQCFEQRAASQTGDRGIMLIEFICSYAGVTDTPKKLVAIYEWRRQQGRVVPQRFLITPVTADALLSADAGSLDELAERLSAPLFGLSAPALLEPVAIAKPWGQEIWFTGVEERGVSRIGDHRGTIPLPWYLQAAPRRLTDGRRGAINLLKILDPLPNPLLGDLYFELHRQKQEVYVVTAIDPVAWPEGQGAIRLGFDPKVRSDYSDDEAFRTAYLEAVKRYRQIRLEIDILIDRMRMDEAVALNEPVAPEVQLRWLAAVPEQLRKREHSLRTEMESFTRLWPLKAGDVVQVPLQTPHALQHGVRTVEFQTPVYERKILSFGQKVLTQPNWDTEEAVAEMELDVEALSQRGTLTDGEGGTRGQGWQLERIVAFDDFVVDRIELKPDAVWPLQASGEYSLVMAIGATFKVGDLSISHEQACFVPAAHSTMLCRNLGAKAGVLLIAEPR